MPSENVAPEEQIRRLQVDIEIRDQQIQQLLGQLDRKEREAREARELAEIQGKSIQGLTAKWADSSRFYIEEYQKVWKLLRQRQDRPQPETFEEAVRTVINLYGREAAAGDTPDFILADYLAHCLDAFGDAVQRRNAWYQHDPAGQGEPRAPDSGTVTEERRPLTR